MPGPVRIRQLPQLKHQTIGFELPHLPGDEFQLVLPELISDAEKAILPWSHPSPNWEIGPDSARYVTDIPHTILVEGEAVFGEEEIQVVVTATNLSDNAWRLANLFTCFAFYHAPSFNDPELARTFIPVADDNWKSLADIFAEHDPGSGRHTFFPVRGGPDLSELWVGRAIDQHYPQVASKGAMCVLSRDGKWVAGMSSPNPAYLFNNRQLHCIHADPLLGTVQPGEVVQAVSTLHVFQGSLQDFDRRTDNGTHSRAAA